jgi:hypothetical protein
MEKKATQQKQRNVPAATSQAAAGPGGQAPAPGGGSNRAAEPEDGELLEVQLDEVAAGACGVRCSVA